MNTYVIEKGISIPEHGNNKNNYPFKKMEVGDSFVVPLNKRGGLAFLSKRSGIKIKTAKIDDAHARVWRVA